jgi:hypothetical protein
MTENDKVKKEPKAPDTVKKEPKSPEQPKVASGTSKSRIRPAEKTVPENGGNTRSTEIQFLGVRKRQNPLDDMFDDVFTIAESDAVRWKRKRSNDTKPQQGKSLPSFLQC